MFIIAAVLVLFGFGTIINSLVNSGGWGMFLGGVALLVIGISMFWLFSQPALYLGIIFVLYILFCLKNLFSNNQSASRNR